MAETNGLMPLGRILVSGHNGVAHITGDFLGSLDKWAQLGRNLAHRKDADYSHGVS